MLEAGKKYFIRTVTDYWLGELVEECGPWVAIFKRVSWVANTGRLGDFMAGGCGNQDDPRGQEIEVFPENIQQKIVYLTVSEWNHDLPTSTFPE